MKLTIRDDGPSERRYVLETEGAPSVPDGVYTAPDWRTPLGLCESAAAEAWAIRDPARPDEPVRIPSPVGTWVNELPEAERAATIRRETRMAHVHGQHREHDPVILQANPQALAAIADAVRALRHTDARHANVDLTTSDGEGYQLEIERVDADFGDPVWSDAELPYFERTIDAALARQREEIHALRGELHAYRQRELIDTLRAISEDVWAAGWLIGIDALVWDSVFQDTGNQEIDAATRQRLKELADLTGCWPIWDDDQGCPTCIAIPEWKRRRGRA